MTRAARISLLTLLFTACRHPSGAARDDGAATVAPHDAAGARTAVDVPTTPPPSPWCFEAMPRADLRAIDDEGYVWTVQGETISREGDAQPTALANEIPCPARGAYALEFAPGGMAYLLVDGRFYARPAHAATFVVTPTCTDLGGTPWTARAQGGWAFIAHTQRSDGSALLMTTAADAATGWRAVTAIDRSVTAVVIDRNQSMLSLINEGHLILVDQLQTVAGEVLAAHGESFATLSRSTAGLVAAHDAPDARRVLVTSRALDQTFARVEARRDQSSPTRAVLAVDLARFVALTDDAVELSVDRGRTFRTVLRRSPNDAGGPSLERPHVGRLRDGRLAVATRDGVAVDRCP